MIEALLNFFILNACGILLRRGRHYLTDRGNTTPKRVNLYECDTILSHWVRVQGLFFRFSTVTH